MIDAIEHLKTFIDSIIINSYNFANSCFKYGKYKNLLSSNVEFKDKHKNERCFILGNGPSLNNVDFSNLKGEYIFTVNQLYKNIRYSELHSNYHIWTDPVFFNMSDKERLSNDYVKEFYKINTANHRPICFMPVQAQEYVDFLKLEKELDIHYLNTCLTFCDNINSSCDFTRLVPSFSTVVINTIQLAVYMGFKEIYLLGCDCTGIVGMIDKEQDKQIKSYAYKLSDRDIVLMDNDFEKAFEGWAKIFHQYKWIGKICKKKGIDLINCTENSILNVITYKSLKCILDGTDDDSYMGTV